MLELSSVECQRNQRTIFNRVSCNVPDGVALQIRGANGTGKSTLLKAIAGVIKPQAGKIQHHGADILYIGHTNNLHPALTARQNLQFLAAMSKSQSKNNLHSDIDAALAYFNLTSVAANTCAKLSAGQQQRLSLARLYLTAAKLWILDEPLASLDQNAHALFLTLCVKHLQSSGIVVCATHELLEFFPCVSNTLLLSDYG